MSTQDNLETLKTAKINEVYSASNAALKQYIAPDLKLSFNYCDPMEYAEYFQNNQLDVYEVPVYPTMGNVTTYVFSGQSEAVSAMKDAAYNRAAVLIQEARLIKDIANASTIEEINNIDIVFPTYSPVLG